MATNPVHPPAVEHPHPQQPVAVQPQPAIRWYVPKIGLPMVSDDPAAKGKKVVMLTFDDGPTEAHTGRILDTLAKENIKAMWFITRRGLMYPEMTQRIHKEGHPLAPHSLSHANLTKLAVPQIREELEPLIKLITEVTGQPPKYFRPPFGAYNQNVLDVSKEYGMELTNWSNGSLDWAGIPADGYKDPKVIVDTVMQQLHPGAVILFHDTHKHTADALPEVIAKIREAGYDFVVLH